MPILKDRENRKWCLYKHTCPDGHVYIGITSVEPRKRWADGFGYEGSWDFFREIVQHGWENIEHEILMEDLDEKKARELEKKTIQKYGSSSCNKVHKLKDGLRIWDAEKVFNESDYAVDDLMAIRMWCSAKYGDNDDVHMARVAKDGGWKRTVYEFATGDCERIIKELIYIDKIRTDRLGMPKAECANEDIKEMAKVLSSSMMDRYLVSESSVQNLFAR